MTSKTNTNYKTTLNAANQLFNSLNKQLSEKDETIRLLRFQVERLAREKSVLLSKTRDVIDTLVAFTEGKHTTTATTTTSAKKEQFLKKTTDRKTRSRVNLVDSSYNSDDDPDYEPEQEDDDETVDDEPEYMDVREYIESLGVNMNKLTSPRAWKSLVNLGTTCKRLADPVKAKRSIITKTGKVKDNVWVNTYTLDQYRNELSGAIRDFRRSVRV